MGPPALPTHAFAIRANSAFPRTIRAVVWVCVPWLEFSSSLPHLLPLPLPPSSPSAPRSLSTPLILSRSLRFRLRLARASLFPESSYCSPPPSPAYSFSFYRASVYFMLHLARFSFFFRIFQLFSPLTLRSFPKRGLFAYTCSLPPHPAEIS